MNVYSNSVKVNKGFFNPFYCFLIFIFATFSFTTASAQETVSDTARYLIETFDGNQFRGVIVKRTNDGIVFNTDNYGTITISQSLIKEMKQIQSFHEIDGQYWPEDIQATRYFWAPNGYGLKKEEGYYQNIWVLWNQVAYGVTDKFSMGGGVIPLFLFDGAPTPVWITPKFSLPVQKDKVNVGIGALLGTVIGEQNDFGILYGTVTFGDRDKNLSLAYGNGFVRDRGANGYWDNVQQVWVETNKPVTSHVNMLSGSFIVRLGPKGYLLSENMIIFESDEDYNFGIISIGGRRIVRNVGLDFGLITPIAQDMGAFIAIPWLGLTVPFN